MQVTFEESQKFVIRISLTAGNPFSFIVIQMRNQKPEHWRQQWRQTQILHQPVMRYDAATLLSFP